MDSEVVSQSLLGGDPQAADNADEEDDGHQDPLEDEEEMNCLLCSFLKELALTS